MPFDMTEMLKISDATSKLGIVVNSDEDLTRQEFKEECDVNHILRQHGYMVRPVVYGEHNFDEDLTAQMQSRSIFQVWYDAAPADIREAYPDMGSFLAAFAAGAFKTGLETPEVPSGGSDPLPSQPEAGAAG